ncbi:MAG: hypothetical protein FJW31_02860 [Acidobacteria bacterium]|nr:hypothetical protein [Acidobacteriota bacterium]
MNIGGPWLILVWIALIAVTTRWLFRDARQRGRTPLATLAMLLAFFPIGPLIWLMVRPPRL